jgi:hypothetical protein
MSPGLLHVLFSTRWPPAEVSGTNLVALAAAEARLTERV